MSIPKSYSQEDTALAAEYALGLLSDDERTAFDRRLLDEPELADVVAQWETDFAQMSDSITPITPPRGAKAQIQKRLWGTVQAKPFWQALCNEKCFCDGLRCNRCCWGS